MALKSREKKTKRKKPEKRREIKWDKLDNTAHLFPVIAGEGMSNVYRVCAVLKEEIKPELLQKALDLVLPQFSVFNSRLRQGMFWYYFEENGKKAPRVVEENTYPCQYIDSGKNRSYMFRVTYYKMRINLEVFHVLTDGMGAFNFLKELTYQYLRLSHQELGRQMGDELSVETSLNTADSFLDNYRKSTSKNYHSQRAYLLKGPVFEQGKMGLLHGFMPVSQLKEKAGQYHASINEYLIAVLLFSIYKENLHGMPGKEPVTTCVPVNLRPYFNSETTKNFFAVITAVFRPEREDQTFQEVITSVQESLKDQLTREHLEEVISYNVSNEKNLMLRAVPLFLKKPAMRYVYDMAARANTTTVTNLGNIKVLPEYEPFIEQFYAFLSRSKGQNLKGCICSYQDTLVFTFSSVLKDSSLQKYFFRYLASEGIAVRIESNGVYYE